MDGQDRNGTCKPGAASANLTPQQTSLVRSVLSDQSDFLNRSYQRDPSTGLKMVQPLSSSELAGFCSRWESAPVDCIRTMNAAIAHLGESRRFSRYLTACFDLELRMDRESDVGSDAGLERVGIPGYLRDGYTDLGFHWARDRERRREKILVDKDRLRVQLLQSKRHAVESLRHGESIAQNFEHLLRSHATSLRESLGYEEKEAMQACRSLCKETIFLSQCVERRALAGRHLSILYQLRLQEAGIASKLVKGMHRLFGLKARHAWNVAWCEGYSALVDVTFAGDDGPFVVVGSTLEQVYRQASEMERFYHPSPDSTNHYEIRSV